MGETQDSGVVIEEDEGEDFVKVLGEFSCQGPPGMLSPINILFGDDGDRSVRSVGLMRMVGKLLKLTK